MLPFLGGSPLVSVVLAGGSGRRLEPLVRSFEGEAVPKQFCRFGRVKSLLEQTLDRIAPLELAAAAVVVDATQVERARPHVALRPGIRLVSQPCDRGTAAGVLLPLLRLLESVPDATVLITPTDHGYRDAAPFLGCVAEARRAIGCGAADLVVLGAEAAAPNPDYGWILPGAALGEGLHRVRGFVEKPPPARARELLHSGALWNTMVVVARGPALVGTFRRVLPLAADGIAEALRRGDAFLRDLYPGLPPADFSRDVLGGATDLAVARLPAAAGWTDLGTPERLLSWLGCEDGVAATVAEPR